jgi:hypothetical protein
MSETVSSEALLMLANRCERHDLPDRSLDGDIAAALGEHPCWAPKRHDRQPELFSDGAASARARTWLAPKYTGSYDAAMSLVPRWLTPTIIGHDREVRLLNGIGGTVGGSDYRSVAPSLQRAITAAAIRARAALTPTPAPLEQRDKA